jgi:Bacterial CdiA-CT RNAse A domain
MKTRIASGSAGSQPNAGRPAFSYTHVLATDDSARLAGNDCATVIQNKIQARIAIAFCLLPELFAISGCGTGPSPESLQRDEKPKVRIDSRFPSGGYNLGRDEQRGGHTLARHVARTDEELRERLAQERNISAASTWTDRETAEGVVGDALEAERSRVESWMRRGYPRANLALHYNAGPVIGRSLRRGDSQTVECSSAVIVLRADGPESFYVLTAYPEARE